MRRIVALLIVLGAVAAGGWFLLRDSSFVAVNDVTITGVSGTQAAGVRAALEAAAREQTTLRLQPEKLSAAVARFPEVKAVRATTSFPHGLSITVIERTPVAALRAGGRTIPVAGDGTLLRDASAKGLPTVSVKTAPAGAKLTDGLALAEVRILAAAPVALRREVVKVFTGSRGLAVQLRNGPDVAFGAPERLAAKWASLTAVLAQPASAGGTLIDLSVPERPAVAGLEPLPDGGGTGTGSPDDELGAAPSGAAGADGGTPAADGATSTTLTPDTPTP
ncbi:Cell division protein FtsQ [Paraconexibacter sp. AEG42_29]|uniref:Cell division protein FtsQ n=1 Tax=Paraconexibacter sp. AEG42_29 TaxID=2997339 RepID=A0AAU7AUJ6_9ACTN